MSKLNNVIRKELWLIILFIVMVYSDIHRLDFWSGFLTATVLYSVGMRIMDEWEDRTRKRLRKDHPA